MSAEDRRSVRDSSDDQLFCPRDTQFRRFCLGRVVNGYDIHIDFTFY